ncbi:hypothetical protein HA402_003092 [Bradysia odoriphaga]|nr:hypothetical protein HA402_003092 [Bradysia odoriphaga]
MSQVNRVRSIAHRYSLNVSTPQHDVSQTGILNPMNTTATDVARPDLYKELKDLEEQDGVIRNNEFILCVICNIYIDEFDGIYIRECLHQVCIDCLRLRIIDCADVAVKCPGPECQYYLQDREIRSLLTQEEYGIHSRKYMFNDNEPTGGGDQNANLYQELLDLESQGSIRTTKQFECQICFTDIQPMDGIIIRGCFHQFCIDCVRGTIDACEEAEIKCPGDDCDGFVHDREVRSLLTQAEFDKYTARIARIAECQSENSYHCKLTNCEGWCIVEDVVDTFICPRCSSNNCLACKAIHPGKNCKQYQDELRYAGMTDDQRSDYYLDEIVGKNEGMRCTKCKIVIMKRDGCDWLMCSMCKTELCWATKQNRWGPKGRGDTSGGYYPNMIGSQT